MVSGGAISLARLTMPLEDGQWGARKGRFRQAMSELQEALRLADSRYEARAITQLDVLKARVALTESRTNRLEANYRDIIAVENLRRARGEGHPELEE